jgi:hypothetical protein
VHDPNRQAFLDILLNVVYTVVIFSICICVIKLECGVDTCVQPKHGVKRKEVPTNLVLEEQDVVRLGADGRQVQVDGESLAAQSVASAVRRRRWSVLRQRAARRRGGGGLPRSRRAGQHGGAVERAESRATGV